MCPRAWTTPRRCSTGSGTTAYRGRSPSSACRAGICCTPATPSTPTAGPAGSSSPSTPPTTRSAASSRRTWTRCSAASRDRTSSAICAGGPDRCTSATAASPSGTATTTRVSCAPRWRTRRAGWSPIAGSPPSTCLHGSPSRTSCSRIWPPAPPPPSPTSRTASSARCTSPTAAGVYVARDLRTDEQVVLKEARPHAGLAADEADAVTRLRRERDALRRLSGLGCTPEVRDWFTLGDHSFLALEYIEGRPLNSFFAHRHPLIEADPSQERLAEYTEWALRVHGLVADAVAAIHARGVVFNDLHLFNIMLSEDETSVVLLDFEAAAVDDQSVRQVIANPGFVAPADRRGFDVDRYALACLRLALFLPLTSLFAVDRAKAVHLARIAAEQFPVPREFLDEAVAEILRGHRHLPPRSTAPPRATGRTTCRWRWRTGRAAATPWSEPCSPRPRPTREDRFFPGDIAQFATAGGGTSFAHGAAGVLYALAETGAARCPEAEEWLLLRSKAPASGSPLGFYDGLSGVAWVLDRLGHREHALALVERITAESWADIGSRSAQRARGTRPRPRRPRHVHRRERAAGQGPAVRRARRRQHRRVRDRGRRSPPGGPRRPAARSHRHGTALPAPVRTDRRRRAAGPGRRRVAPGPGPLRTRRRRRPTGRRGLADDAVPRRRQCRHRHGARRLPRSSCGRGVRTGTERDRAGRAGQVLCPAGAVPRRGGHGAVPEPHHRRRPRYAHRRSAPADRLTLLGRRPLPGATWPSPGSR